MKLWIDPMDYAGWNRNHICERVSLDLNKVGKLLIIHQKTQLKIPNQFKIKWDPAFYIVCAIRQSKYWLWLILSDWLRIRQVEHAGMLQSQVSLVNSNLYLREILSASYNSLPEITILLLSVGLVKNSKVIWHWRANYSFE